MTRHRSVLISNDMTVVKEHPDEEKAELYEYDIRSRFPNVRTYTIGDINGPIYTVVYLVD